MTLSDTTSPSEDQGHRRCAEPGENGEITGELLADLPGLMLYRCENDGNRTMTFVSPGCNNLTGYQPSDLIRNARIAYGWLIHPDDRQHLREVTEMALARRQPYQLSYRIICRNGKQKRVYEHGQGLFDEKGGLRTLEGLIHEVAEPVHTDPAREDWQAFLAAAHHDLCSPLNAILGFARLMVRSQTLAPDHRESAEIILRNGEDLLTRINTLPGISGIGTGQTGPADISDLTGHHSDSLLSVRHDTGFAEAQPEENQLTAESFASLPPALPMKLRRAIVRLDADGIREIVEEFRAHNPQLAHRLAQLVYEFQYDRILAICPDNGTG